MDLSAVDVNVDGVQGDGSGVFDHFETVFVLASDHSLLLYVGVILLNDDLAIVLKRLEVGLQRQVIVEWLDIFWQHLTTLGDVQAGRG